MILSEPPIDMIISGIVATSKAVMIAAIFKEAVDETILNVIFKKTTENNTRRWMSSWRIWSKWAFL
jgi:hypothetical protein